MLTHGRPSDAAKYEDSIKVLINYVLREYLVGVYIGQGIQYGKVPTLDPPENPTKYNNN